MNIVTLIIVWLVTSISLLVISKLPLGVEIDTPVKAFFSAAILGIVTAIVRPILRLLFLVPNLVTFDLLSGFFTFIIGVICFSIAAWLVQGYRIALRHLECCFRCFHTYDHQQLDLQTVRAIKL
jgi:putative membrane protein